MPSSAFRDKPFLYGLTQGILWGNAIGALVATGMLLVLRSWWYIAAGAWWFVMLFVIYSGGWDRRWPGRGGEGEGTEFDG